MLRFYKIQDGLIKELDVPEDEQRAYLKQADWIDACEPTEDERQLLQTLVKSDIPAFDDVEEIEASARCFVDHAGVHVHSLFLNLADGRHNTVSVAFILQKNCLITIRETELADFRLLRMRARREQVEARDASEMLVTILDQKVENHADGLEDLHRQLENVSYLVLEDEDAELDDAISQLAKLEDSNGKTRLCLMDTQRNLSFLLRHLQKEGEIRETLREINRDIETLMSHTTFLFDKINFLMDSTQGFINIEQNQIIKIFSIAAVVFLPPTLIASIYGMNFQHMPELDWPWAYPMALGLMVLAAFAPYWYFKRKGWL
ncbi:magnesium/cobalt transporter CorA [Marinobacter persicus]|jgi:magnesium transporter|uniref:Magnesium transport protein CorA n=1 Tax=Marinobacter persicus TaxID=930118 RepID=A0A2S6G8L9_9GAMM|nr:magnesium/cobalt transporter CorA [Marinobacter persicus]KXS51050.1 MAG: magnesium transporter [Marinobacter sp. T13-3]PPK52596.1 magnesium transporter [Marinobacter persicus]PPK55569.1 magnesium transporter [Marinobacter persicus]PPK58441.1 magnesium transporter [Marinobacter persicus]